MVREYLATCLASARTSTLPRIREKGAGNGTEGNHSRRGAYGRRSRELSRLLCGDPLGARPLWAVARSRLGLHEVTTTTAPSAHKTPRVSAPARAGESFVPMPRRCVPDSLPLSQGARARRAGNDDPRTYARHSPGGIAPRSSFSLSGARGAVHTYRRENP